MSPENLVAQEDNNASPVLTDQEHETLKYHLLGPSLTKAGQDSVDQQKVSEIIYNASKGSKFFNNEEVKDKQLSLKIDRILERKKQLEKLDLTSDLRRADEYIAELELNRDLSQIVVHIDCDAFYAAVEELDQPELKHVPMAVGKGVLTTCNYHARKFGCRSGMAGFVAMKLCPNLICLPLNFDKYTAKAKEVRAILEQYDPRFESASIDEAYLNITKYCHDRQMTPEDAVAQLRQEVALKTQITVSAGIAVNAKIAKIASNKNKPNGQFRVPSDRTNIIEFMRDLPTRKVNGVGRVFERELGAIGVKTCGDIYSQRAYLPKLFGDKAFQFLINCYLGLGRTEIRPAEEYERKSVGTESTFHDLQGKEALREKLRSTAEELEKDLLRTQVKGRTLVLKVKLHTYEVYTRQVVPPKAIFQANDLYNYSLPMLAKLEKEFPGLKLRLMGLRVTHLVSTKAMNLDFFGKWGKRPTESKDTSDTLRGTVKDADGSEWEVWPEEEFEAAATREREDAMAEMAILSQEHLDEENGGEMNSTRESETPFQESVEDSLNEKFWDCPICTLPQRADDKIFNEHIDHCLSKQTIKELVKDGGTAENATPESSSKPKVGIRDPNLSSNLKRRQGPQVSSGSGKRRRPFFQC
ncbi:DNA-directed polymeras-like protein kappa [Xylona heveae TC161]|uniref:DNA polymerase kappa n=1 Tax=Xylona heveae (strain CBS 132557 / TC161) TaxID=1328760 RepID=A0A165I0Y4_XYLHT|nr:DNA-directed polymeras-like protein kappa [Xylona heveae TC161]KZF24202.1 DNA-directed polymeras-like protein kappa [Xylona heveae TC161]